MGSNLQNVYPSGWLKSLNDNIGLLNVERTMLYSFNWDDYDNDGALISAVGAHAIGKSMPANALIIGGFMEVVDPVTGETNATIALSVQGANDIVAAAAVSGAPWSTVGAKAIVPKANTPESTSIKIGTVDKPLTVTVGTAALTAGRVNVYLKYVEGEERAS